jgi:predicted nucleotidyltransferase
VARWGSGCAGRPSASQFGARIGTVMQRSDLLRDVLAACDGVELAVLFGSGARGQLRATSDFDVAVRLASTGPSLSELQIALERAAGRPVDLVDLDRSSPQLRFEIARHGRVLVERGAHAWADFAARATIDWWDWAPTARRAHRAAARRIGRRVGDGSR